MRLFIVAAGWLLLFQEGKGAMGPWVGVINQVTKCSDENQDLPPVMSLSINKNGKYGRIIKDGSFDSNFGISNDSEMIARISEFKNGRWELVLKRNLGKTCDAMNTFIPHMLKLMYQQIPDIETYEDGASLCSKPGSGKLMVPFDINPITVENIPTFIYGAYKAEITVQHPNQTVFRCTSVSGEVVAKPTTARWL